MNNKRWPTNLPEKLDPLPFLSVELRTKAKHLNDRIDAIHQKRATFDSGLQAINSRDPLQVSPAELDLQAKELRHQRAAAMADEAAVRMAIVEYWQAEENEHQRAVASLQATRETTMEAARAALRKAGFERFLGQRYGNHDQRLDHERAMAWVLNNHRGVVPINQQIEEIKSRGGGQRMTNLQDNRRSLEQLNAELARIRKELLPQLVG